MTYGTISGFELMLSIILVVALAIGVPLLEIWAINTAFDAGIAYNFWTWLAFFVLNSIIGNLFKS